MSPVVRSDNGWLQTAEDNAGSFIQKMKTTLRSPQAQEMIFYVLVCMQQTQGVFTNNINLTSYHTMCFVSKGLNMNGSWEEPHNLKEFILEAEIKKISWITKQKKLCPRKGKSDHHQVALSLV